MIDPTEKRMTVRDCGSYFDIWRDEACIARYLDHSSAAFIVRACNNHKALLDVLKSISNPYDGWNDTQLRRRTDGDAHFQAVQSARAAIASAEKE